MEGIHPNTDLLFLKMMSRSTLRHGSGVFLMLFFDSSTQALSRFDIVIPREMEAQRASGSVFKVTQKSLVCCKG